MKNRLWTLVKGELDRLNKYGVFSISILVAFIWGAVLFVVSDNILALFLPMVLFLDATMMSIMYIGAEMHFEKTESTISTMLVTPVTNAQMVASKVIANTIHNLTSSLLIIGAFYLAGKMEWVMDPGINLPIVLLGVVVATSTFTILGLVLSYYQKDFTEMLVNMFIIVIFLMIPSILLMFGVLKGDVWENVMLINPMQAALEIIQAGIDPTGMYEFGYKYYVSLGYIFGSGVLIYQFLAVPKFQDYAVRQSGV